MDTIEIDEARHIIYTLSFREFNEKEDIKPCNIDVYHLGAFGKGISKVTSISQFQLVKEIQKFNKSKEEDSIQIVGLHSVNITESDTIHFVLTTSKGLRIYVSLSVENYLDEKIRELKGFDYTTYHNERPDGEWRIVGIFNPPLPKDIIGFTKDQERCCSDFSFVNQESCVIKSFYSKGSIFLNGINTSNDRKVLLYINDSEACIKNTGDHSYRHSVSEKFWAIKIPEDVYLLEIQKKPLELYVDEDVLNCIGYFKKKTMSESINIKKNKHNLYINSKKHIYSEQIYLPGEEFILMNSNEILTISKKRPIDELFTLIYISQLPHTDMNREISAFIDDHGAKETCVMLLQILCNPNDTYQLNLKYTKNLVKNRDGSIKSNNISSRSFHEERKEDDFDLDDKFSSFADYCIVRSPNESMISYARTIFFRIGNVLPNYSSIKETSFSNPYIQPLVGNLGSKENEIQSVKMSSLYLYTSRILQPIFQNYLAFLTSLNDSKDFLPNMGVSEKRITAVKLTNLITFIKNEEKYLKKIDKEVTDTKKGYKDAGYDTRRQDALMGYESILCKESEDLDSLKTFIFRCIMGIEFLDEISKVSADFTKAIKSMTNEDKKAMEEFTFRDLMYDILNDTVFNTFLKRLLEVKAEQCGDIKEAKRMCETWHKRCSIFIDREFINVFIAEYQLQKMLEDKKFDEEVFNMCLRDLKEYSHEFEIDKIVYLMVKLDRVKELISLLCIRFLYIQEYEEQESKYSTREHTGKLDHTYYREQENICIKPILEILEQVFNAYVKKIRNTDGGAINFINSILETKKEESIYEFYSNQYLQKMTIPALIDLKSNLIEIILLHDSEKLHGAVLTWMMGQELYEDLDKVNSKYYEKLIEKIEHQNLLNTNQIMLVYKFLAKSEEHIRLINFLVPIIDCDISNERCKIKDKCTIKQRLIYADILINSIHSAIKTSTNTIEHNNILKDIEKTKETLIIQSNIENVLLKIKKSSKNQNEVRRISEDLERLNSKVFTLNSLINDFAKPHRLYDMIISIYKQSVISTNNVPANCKEDIEDCYVHILNYHCENRKNECPRLLYEVLLNYAHSFYINLEGESNISSGKFDRSIKSLFFPLDSLYSIVETINMELFGDYTSNINFIEDALHSDKIKNTPYWFIGLLQVIYVDSLSNVIKFLNKKCVETNKVITVYELVIAIKRFSLIVNELEEGTFNPDERNIINEYKGYELTMNQIIKRLRISFDDEEMCAMYNAPILERFNQLLNDVSKPKKNYIEVPKTVEIQESPSVKLTASFRESPIKDSFIISSSKDSNRTESIKQKFEEEKTKKNEDSDSDDGFVRRTKPQGKFLSNKNKDSQETEAIPNHPIPKFF